MRSLLTLSARARAAQRGPTASSPAATSGAPSSSATTAGETRGTKTTSARIPTSADDGGVPASAEPIVDDLAEVGDTLAAHQALVAAEAYLATHPKRWTILLGWALTRSLGGVVDPKNAAEISRAWFDEWLLGRSLQQSAVAMGVDQDAAMLGTGLARILTAHDRALWSEDTPAARCVMETLLRDGDVQAFLRVNRYRDVLYFDRDRFQELANALLTTAAVLIGADDSLTAEQATRELSARHAIVRAMLRAEEGSGYRVEELLRLLAA